MIILASILMLALCVLVGCRRRQTHQKRKGLCTKLYLNTILQNVEAYDGTPKGQKRLEDRL